MIIKKIKISSVILMLFISIFVFSLNFSVKAQQVKFCCERTTYGAWCQNAPEEECDEGYNCGIDEKGNLLKCRKTPTSCEATSYCRLGCCYDSSEGICMEKTPQKVCQDSGGTWSDDAECNIAQCQLGCCILGTQAAFVTLTRCKKLSSFYGLITNFRRDIGNELSCISLASLSDQGACVYEVDFVKTCKFTSRQECNSIKQGMNIGNKTELGGGRVTSNVEFYKDLLCTAEELGTSCSMTKQTTCIEGRDEVYFVDSCGNIANIYDASKIDDKAYWRKKISKVESCGSGSSNINSRTCGNCNYFEGSICGEGNAKYGDYICKDLNCHASDTSDGKLHKHGESWCSTDKYPDSVGSRYFRHICMNGEEIIEPCADFRQEICIQDYIESGGVKFSQAGCRVNRWQDCYSQTEKKDCENKDKRDCKWILKTDKVAERETEEGKYQPIKIGCVPEHSPGLKFWEEGEAQGTCSLANSQCVVEFVKEGFLKGGGKKCEDNCECLEDSWKQEQLEKCEQIGDCGAKTNWIGNKGNKEGYDIKITEQ